MVNIFSDVSKQKLNFRKNPYHKSWCNLPFTFKNRVRRGYSSPPCSKLGNTRSKSLLSSWTGNYRSSKSIYSFLQRKEHSRFTPEDHSSYKLKVPIISNSTLWKETLFQCHHAFHVNITTWRSYWKILRTIVEGNYLVWQCL